MIKKVRIFIHQNLNLFLLLSTLGLMISPSFGIFVDEKYAQQFFFTVMFLSSVLAVKSHNNKLLYIAVVLSLILWIDILFINIRFALNYILIIVYFAYILSRIIIQLINVEEVTADVIMEAINVYLLIGILGAALLKLLNIYVPGSIEAISPNADIHEYLYFSFVTLTTLGYGDISPSFPLAKTLTVLLAIFGQFYIAVIMAFLVSKFMSNKNNKNTKN